VSRAFECLLLVVLIGQGVSRGQTQAPQQKPAEQQPPDEANPPEEDESVAPKKYILNPSEAKHDIKIGNFYWDQGKYRAALGRYKEATQYNPNSAEAFLKVGETEAKLHNDEAAKAAFQKVIKLAPDSKFAAEAKKRLAKS
jgi:tetratricopeptide (TPR) repeat protein